MSISPYGTLKLVYGVGVITVAAWVALDPTTKTFILAACIVSLPPTITGIFNILVNLTGQKILKKVEVNTNSANTMLRQQRNEATKRADIAEGAEVGRQLARTEASEDAAKAK
jgi:hypothetical protein